MIAAPFPLVATLVAGAVLAGAPAIGVPSPPAAAGAGSPLPSGPAVGQTPAASVPLAPATVVARYAQALHKIKEPSVITFDYTLAQTGLRTLAQTHRVFRSGDNERDETLTVDGKRLTPPKVRIFRGRRNRYTLALLAPRPADYRFMFVGTQKDGHHVDYLFRTIAAAPRPFNVSGVIVDGVRFLPLAIDFTTGAHQGAGRVSFGSNAHWWVPYFATARATLAADIATEQLTFYTYRFPPSLPPTTFGTARTGPALPQEFPAAGGAGAPARPTAPAGMTPAGTTAPAGPAIPAIPLPARTAAPRRRAAPLVAPVNRVLAPGAARPFVPLATPAHPTPRQSPHPRPRAHFPAPRPTLVPIAPGL